MMNKLFVFGIVIFLLISCVVAQDDEPVEVGPGGEPTQTGQQLNHLLQGNNPGTIVLTEPTQFNAGKYGGTAGVGEVSRGVGESHFDSLQEVRGGGMFMTGGQDVTIKDNGDYTAARVSMVDQGPIILTDAYDVRWENGVMTAGGAASMDYKGSTSNDIIMLVADNKKFSVGKASAVQAGCFLVEDVENAEFNVGKIMTMTTSGRGKVVYDQGQKVEYSAKDLNSSITGSITACRRPTYQVKAMELNTRTGNITEIVNGSGEIQLDGRYGIVCVNLTPVSTYDIDTGRYEDSFGFVIRDYAYKLCIQKAVAQQLVADCPLCGLVDLANQKLLLNGVIEYTRYVFDSALIDANKRTAFRTTGFGKNVIDLQKGEVLIQQDEPEFQTVPSNYLELREMKASEPTHRFLGINEKLDRVSTNWVNKYTTVYSGSKTTIVDNMLDYQKGACHVAVLPPQSSQISSIISSLNKQQARYP